MEDGLDAEGLLDAGEVSGADGLTPAVAKTTPSLEDVFMSLVGTAE